MVEGSPAAPDRLAGLPVFLTSFVGRRRDIEAIADLLAQHRMVTITGPGGIGKTRLAVKAVEDRISPRNDEVVFVDYSGADESATALAEVATALGVAPQPGIATSERLLRRLGSRPTLLLLDNCEQLVETLRRQATLLLQRCPRLRILATSRGRIGVPGEVLYQVRPFPNPSSDWRLEPENEAEHEALSLFEQRATAIQSDFKIGPENIATVARICARLDGIPLAIELATARLRIMSLGDLEDGLGDRFRLLKGGVSGRHESLRATIDWSSHLLDDYDRSLYYRLCVFGGGFRIDAAEAVAGDPDHDVFDSIERLVDKSLLQVSCDPDGHTRYRMLSCIREYGLDELRASGGFDEAHARHLAHYLGIAREAAVHAESSSDALWLDRLQADHDNILQAIAWSHGHRTADFIELVTANGWYWQRRGDPAEGRHWLDIALTCDCLDDHWTARLLRWATTLAAYERDMVVAERLAQRSLEVTGRLPDIQDRAHALLAVGNLLFQGNDPVRRAEASAYYEEAYRLYEDAGATVRCIRVALNLSMMSLAFGLLDDARRHAMRALQLASTRDGDQHVGRALIRLGLVAFMDGDDQATGRFLQESLQRPGAREHGMSGLYICLVTTGAVAARRRRHKEAAHLAGAASGVANRQVVQPAFPRELREMFDSWQERASQALGPAAYREQWEAGRDLTDADARSLLLEFDFSAGDRPQAQLSGREMEIVQLVADGLTNRRIGSRLGLSVRTVDAHLDHIRNKLGLRTRAQIVRWLVEAARRLEPERREVSG